MKFDLKAPCAQCPFRTDVVPYLTPERAEEIVAGITEGDGAFVCHKTLKHVDGELQEHDDSKHCAGALILLERVDRPNQVMRIAERLGLYNRTGLDMRAPVFETPQRMLEAFGAGCVEDEEWETDEK